MALDLDSTELARITPVWAPTREVSDAARADSFSKIAGVQRVRRIRGRLAVRRIPPKRCDTDHECRQCEQGRQRARPIGERRRR